MGNWYNDTKLPTHTTADEKRALLSDPHPAVPLPWGRHPVHVVDFRDSEQIRAAERQAKTLPPSHYPLGALIEELRGDNDPKPSRLVAFLRRVWGCIK